MNKKFYETIEKEDAYALAPGTFVYITMDGMFRAPALTMSSPYLDCLKAMALTDDGTPVELLLGSRKLENWIVEVENGFTVETPDGTLHVFDKGDEEYPGVMVNLYGPESKLPVGLAMVEHIPGGEEGICSYMPAQMDAMQAEFDEVPLARMTNEDGTPAENKEVPLLQSGKYAVSGGLVTRAWPDETHDEETHRRVFHYGYKEEKLYHATWKAYYEKIKKEGLLPNQSQTWAGCETGYVYLSDSPKEAADFCAAAPDNFPREIYDQGIIVFSVEKAILDKTKLIADPNIILDPDTEPSSFAYQGKIDSEKLFDEGEWS